MFRGLIIFKHNRLKIIEMGHYDENKICQQICHIDMFNEHKVIDSVFGNNIVLHLNFTI